MPQVRVRVTAALVFAFFAGACASTGGGPRPFPHPGDGVARQSPGSPGSVVVGTAMSLLGAPYGFGASGPERFDCSGFTQYVLGLHGRALPREVADQFHVGLLVEGAPEAGDLVFFAVEGAGPTHVGIAIGDGAFVHAPSSRGVVRVERLNTAYWRARYIGSRRVTATTPR